jgi:hypothetical protein
MEINNNLKTVIMSQNFDKKKEVVYRFHITYNDLLENDSFVRGTNIILEKDNMIEALKEFEINFVDVEILGVLKSEIEK